MSELPKTFDPAAIEAKWYAHWESTGAFRPARPHAEPYTIVMPPPNVTGSLHIGHALDNTLQDILIRHARLQGKDALWVVGTDHAGIATQMVVERQMNARQQKRTDFTRDEFIDKVWEWKAESGGTITSQLRRLGASCDWSREQFTMDPGFEKAVIKVFVDLYNQGLLYRDKRLVNWDPGLKTAISDLEVETVEVNGKFWHFKYPLADGSGHISVATTRPETMLADMAVAVNPQDDRYKALVGTMVKLPITGRLIPIVADDHADPELGSGAVKITPGHDFNDFEVGKRAGFKAGDMLNMLDAEARLVQTADGLIPEDLLGLTVAEARKIVVERIDAAGLLEKVEDRVIQTPYGDRSGVVIEPWLTDQWYVDAETLAKPAIEAVRSGAIKVVPASWEKTYFNWMENIQPWCVSRQLWWGHQIPAWFGPPIGHDEHSLATGSFAWLDEIPDLENPQARLRSAPEVFVAETFEEALLKARSHYSAVGINFEIEGGFRLREVDGVDQARTAFSNGELGLWRDPDVLDTWFSSALWPFGTLGWPGDAGTVPSGTVPNPGTDKGTVPEGTVPGTLLSRHYPGDVLISGFDILFFWDARMIMQGLHFMKEAPFKTLYLHGLVRAADGSKMSKSKGNTVDPLGLIDQYGADALRFTLTAMESQGRDIKLDEKRVEGYRNFATKLWNAARFCQANGIGASTSVAAPAAALAVNRWIIGEVVETLAKLDQAITDLRFDAMADAIYHFAWGTFCDWYLELIKPVLSPGTVPSGTVADDSAGGTVPEGTVLGAEATETRAVAGWVFDQILVMLHPFMPFITEELWASMGARECGLIHARWPEPGAEMNAEAKAEIDWLIGLIQEIRSARTEMNIPPSQQLALNIGSGNVEWLQRHFDHQPTLARMCKVIPVRSGASTDEPLRDGIEAYSVDEMTSQFVERGAIQIVYADANYFIPLAGVVDLTAERTRLTNAITAITKERDSLSGRLNNPAFVEKAKPEAVEKARADHAEKTAEAERLAAALARLG